MPRDAQHAPHDGPFHFAGSFSARFLANFGGGGRGGTLKEGKMDWGRPEERSDEGAHIMRARHRSMGRFFSAAGL